MVIVNPHRTLMMISVKTVWVVATTGTLMRNRTTVTLHGMLTTIGGHILSNVRTNRTMMLPLVRTSRLRKRLFRFRIWILVSLSLLLDQGLLHLRTLLVMATPLLSALSSTSQARRRVTHMVCLLVSWALPNRMLSMILIALLTM
jgi:hypothetical protein